VERPQVEPALQESLERLVDEVAGLRASGKRLALAADADRRAIERDLHDGLQQHLVALAVEVQLMQLAVADAPDSLTPRLVELGASIREALDEADRLAHRIRPPLLATAGLAPALRASAAGAGVRVELEISAGHPWAPEIAGAVYACCLAVLERARAGTEATIRVDEEGDTIRFEAAARTDPSAAAPEAVVVGLRDRVNALGGELSAAREDGDRLHVSGSLPTSV
jgi:signal transduction histidine kinase